jgi:hypothetical protein
MGEGKKVHKVGMKDVQRDGWEYELTVSLNIDRDTHLATPSKDRTNLFEGQPAFIITEATGELIKQWCETGSDPVVDAITAARAATSIDELQSVWNANTALHGNAEFKAVVSECKASLTPKS